MSSIKQNLNSVGQFELFQGFEPVPSKSVLSSQDVQPRQSTSVITPRALPGQLIFPLDSPPRGSRRQSSAA